MDSKVVALFKELELVLTESIARAAPIESDVYVCGFWLFYCDYQNINAPCFAHNNEPADPDNRWSPPEWSVDVQGDVYESVMPLYETLTSLMSGKSDAEWEELIQYQYEFYCNLCVSLNSNLSADSSPFKNWKTTPDFLIGIFEEREGETTYKVLIESSLGKPLATKIGIL